MAVSQTVRILLGLSLLAGMACAQNCANLPTSFTGNEFPNGDFFTNFNNSCYTIGFSTGDGGNLYGDLNAQYYTMYYKADPRYQLILVSAFPNARYYSVTLYDEHNALSQTILDTNIVPLTSQYVNPFQPGVPFVSGQQFAVPITFGGTTGTLEPGCTMNQYNVTMNNLDGSVRHPGMDWNSDAGFFQAFPNFDFHNVDTARHQNPNTAGVVMVRVYVDGTPLSYATNPHIIVRDVASGCAYPAAYAQDTLGIVTNVGNKGRVWMDQKQAADHQTYDEKYLPQLCYGPGPIQNQLQWTRVEEYVAWTNPDAAYISAPVPKGLPQTLAATGEVLRIRVRVPVTPPTPCTNGCARTGNEQMRYMSLSFRNPDGTVFATLDDAAFTTDANGYATLIVGTGAAIPSWITPQNGYTYLDLTASSNYQDLSQITMRHMIPGPGFTCGGQVVPYRMSPATPAGGLMSDYQPVADYPVAALLPQVAVPLVGPGACDTFPNGDPGIRPACGIFPSPVPEITSVITECHIPECEYFVAQPNPPITIIGSGFGMFPSGVPFTGTSNYLRITNLTQGWIAGYAGTQCNISVNSWETGRIQLNADFDRHGACPISGGDKLLVEVWNPQTTIEAQFPLTVINPLDHTPSRLTFGKP